MKHPKLPKDGQEKLRRLQKLFERADIDGNGKLDAKELQFLMVSAFRSTIYYL